MPEFNLKSGDNGGRSTVLKAIVVGISSIVIGILLLPIAQTFLYDIFIQTPATLYWLLIGGVLALVIGSKGYGRTATALLGLTIIMAFIVGPFMSGVYAQEHIVHSQEFEQVNALANTSNTHVRVLPRHVAETYADSSMQFPVYQLTQSDITYHDGSYTWSQGLAPDKIVVVLTGQQHGAFFTNMETTRKDVDIVEHTMQCGQGQLVTDSYGYRMNLDRFDVDHNPATAFNLVHEGELYIAQSYVTHQWRFGNPLAGELPQPYVVPRYGGTLVMDDSCNVRDISASEVPQTDLLENQSAYPYDLARFRVTSMQLIHGLGNKIFVGEDVPKIAPTPGKGNSQPYTVPMADGSLSYFMAMKPSGSGSGVFQVYTLDAQTGDIQFVEYNETQAGPQKAADFVRKENPRVNWVSQSSEGSSGTMTVAEPIPVVKNGVLYWHVRVVPKDGSGIAYTAFVNAQTADVTEMANDKEIYAFVREEALEDVEATTTNETTSEGMTQIAVIEDGKVVRTINISKNATIRIEQEGT